SSIDQPSAAWRAWVWSPALRWMTTAGAAVLLIMFVIWRPTVHAPTPALHVIEPAVAPPSQPAEATSIDVASRDDVDGDQAWAVVRTAAHDFGWEEARAAGLSAHPGSADSMALELTGEERAELVRILAGEIKHNGA